MRKVVRETDHAEIVAMEQELIAEGMPVEEIQSMCDLHSQVTREVLVQLSPVTVPAGHPVDTFRRAVEKGQQEDDGKGPRREGYADGFDD